MKHPLSINFKTLLQYDFERVTIEEVIFFEWLVIKRASFGNEKFFYQQSRITNELGIKRTRLTRIKEAFTNDLNLKISLEGFRNLTHFIVSDNFIKNFVDISVRQEFKKDLLKRILEFKMGNALTMDEDVQNEIEFLIVDLNRTYNDRREIASLKTGKKYTYTELPYNNKTCKQLSDLMVKYSVEVIENTFIAYCDEMIRKKDKAFHMLNNFSSYDEKEGRFGVFERYLTFFNENYSVTI